MIRRPPRPPLFPSTTLFRSDLELVAFLHGFSRLRRLQDGIAHVDRVAEEDARVGVRDHQRYARAADRDRRDLARRAAAEVRVGDRKSTRLNSSHLVISYAVF